MIVYDIFSGYSSPDIPGLLSWKDTSWTSRCGFAARSAACLQHPKELMRENPWSSCKLCLYVSSYKNCLWQKNMCIYVSVYRCVYIINIIIITIIIITIIIITIIIYYYY